MKKKTVEKEEAIRLRVKDRKSLREIASLVKVSKGTLSVWLRSYPLTEQERYSKHYDHLKVERPERRKENGLKESALHRQSPSDLSRLDKAKIAEAATLLRLCVHRLTVYGSPFDGDKADWLVEDGNTLETFRVQVKWARRASCGRPSISLVCMERGKGRRYREGEFDFIVGYDLFADVAYVYSFDELKGIKTRKTVDDEGAEAWWKIKAEIAQR